MNKQCITKDRITAYREYLYREEKSAATIEKYMHDVRSFAEYAQNRKLDKELVLEYKKHLAETYALSSVNSILAAINGFMGFIGRVDCCVKQFRVQKQTYCTDEKELTKEEYVRLVKTAEMEHNDRISLVLQTICGSGIRVSELRYITVEAVMRGRAEVTCKGKTRVILIVDALKRKLLRYAKAQHITSGSIFVTRNGRTLDRSNIWREMKALCERASVSPTKVFPHNLRHLFARIFYRTERDIAKLADILGHTSINTTRIYLTSTETEHRHKMENMRLIL